MEKEALSLDESFNKIGFGRFHVLLVVLSGIVQSFDAIEMLILAFLGPILSCSWKINVIEESFLTTSVFIGAMIGGILFGNLSDRYGRKTVIVLSSMILIYSALLSAFSPLIEWLILLRCLVGFALGGIMVSFSTLASELIPIKQRGIVLVIILGFWPIGSYFVTVLSMYIAPFYGWRMLLLVSVLPLICTLPMLYWVPESPRFLVLRNRKPEAIEVINKIAMYNRSEAIRDINESDQLQPPGHFITELFHPKYIVTTCCVNFLWIVSGVSYYSIILLVILINERPHICVASYNTFSTTQSNLNSSEDNSCCVKMNWNNYKDSYISTSGELLFLIVSIVMMSLLSRKLTMAIFSITISLSFALLNLCLPIGTVSIILMIIRGCVFSVFNLDYIYTCEVFPTSIRSLAMGLCYFSARIGAILSPFIVNILTMRFSFVMGTVLLSSINLLSFIVTLIMPYETKHRRLYQTAASVEESDIKEDQANKTE